jgi:RHS repeat-associated protein
MTLDGPKGITISYNYLNLPATASGGQGSIEWYYDATGRKLRKVSGSNSVTYADGIEKYDNGSTFVMHPEGRSAVIPVGEEPLPWHVEFSIRDHLGNTRVAFSDLNDDGRIQLAGTDPSGVPIPEDYTEILQENHYYPFGLNMEGKWYPPLKPERENKHQYNGKEYNDDLGLNWNDYGARWYDAAIGRWNSVDPLADIAPDWTPYRYTFNNPINFSDPDGLFETKDEAKKYKEENNIKGRVRKQSDGTWAIENKSKHYSYQKDAETGEVYSAVLATGSKPMSLGEKFTSFDGWIPGFHEISVHGWGNSTNNPDGGIKVPSDPSGEPLMITGTAPIPSVGGGSGNIISVLSKLRQIGKISRSNKNIIELANSTRINAKIFFNQMTEGLKKKNHSNPKR